MIAQPLGPWLVAAVGIGVMGAGLAAAYYAWTVDFKAEMTIEKRFRRWASLFAALDWLLIAYSC